MPAAFITYGTHRLSLIESWDCNDDITGCVRVMLTYRCVLRTSETLLLLHVVRIYVILYVSHYIVGYWLWRNDDESGDFLWSEQLCFFCDFTLLMGWQEGHLVYRRPVFYPPPNGSFYNKWRKNCGGGLPNPGWHGKQPLKWRWYIFALVEWSNIDCL